MSLFNIFKRKPKVTRPIQVGDKVTGKKFPFEGLLFEVTNVTEQGQWLTCKGIGDNPYEVYSGLASSFTLATQPIIKYI